MQRNFSVLCASKPNPALQATGYADAPPAPELGRQATGEQVTAHEVT